MKHELTTYRIEQVVFNEGTAWEETADEYVPDGRLQAIADAWWSSTRRGIITHFRCIMYDLWG